MSTDPPPVMLTAAFWLVVAESVVEGAVVAGTDQYGRLGRVLLIGAFVTKIGFAHLARRRVAAGALGLLAFEAVGVLVALGATWPIWTRLALAATVVTVFVLVLGSLRTFPPPELPSP